MKLKNEKYYVNRHSCYLLQYHLVLVTKYRHPVIQGRLEEALKEYTCRYFAEREIPLNAVECMPDHMHLLFDFMPQKSLAEFINAFKTGSSRYIRKQFAEELEPYYWKPYFWSLSYFIGTVSDRTAEAVKSYINDQKKG